MRNDRVVGTRKARRRVVVPSRVVRGYHGNKSRAGNAYAIWRSFRLAHRTQCIYCVRLCLPVFFPPSLSSRCMYVCAYSWAIASAKTRAEQPTTPTLSDSVGFLSDALTDIKKIFSLESFGRKGAKASNENKGMWMMICFLKISPLVMSRDFLLPLVWC